ncbi:hypothetical protein [Streptomyces sp. NPDC088730]|uniref:hypothetical protein n=1 Tax=Streptomyces sp. NPDC088730 TaxID=3365877 RepID=UPI003813797E
MVLKPGPGYVDLEFLGADPGAGLAVGQKDGDGLAAAVAVDDALADRFGAVLRLALQLDQVEAVRCGVGRGVFCEVGQRARVLAVVTDVGEEEGAVVDASLCGKDERGHGLPPPAEAEGA